MDEDFIKDYIEDISEVDFIPVDSDSETLLEIEESSDNSETELLLSPLMEETAEAVSSLDASEFIEEHTDLEEDSFSLIYEAYFPRTSQFVHDYTFINDYDSVIVFIHATGNNQNIYNSDLANFGGNYSTILLSHVNGGTGGTALYYSDIKIYRLNDVKKGDFVEFSTPNSMQNSSMSIFELDSSVEVVPDVPITPSGIVVDSKYSQYIYDLLNDGSVNVVDVSEHIKFTEKPLYSYDVSEGILLSIFLVLVGYALTYFIKHNMLKMR